jgi:putative PEP-CTERM system TPR-repeat lipoprotein
MKIENCLAASLTVVFLLGGVAGCSKTADNQALISEARAYQKKGESKAAIIQLKNALQQNPEDRDARLLLGQIYSQTGDPQSAEKELRKALSLGASPADVLPALGRTLLQQNQFQKVLDEVKLTDGAKPNAELLSLRGNAYLGLRKIKEAKESFALALTADPAFPDALIGSARQALADGNVPAATLFAEQAVDKNPTNVEVWLFKGDLMRMQRKPDDALLAYATVIKLQPTNIAPYVSRALVYGDKGNFDAANAELAAARKQDAKSLQVTYTQALLESGQGKHAAALESVQQVLRVAPDHMPSVLLAGATQYALGATQQAEQHLKKYLERAPGNKYASKLLIATLLKNGDTARALKVLTPMLPDGDKDPQLLALAGEAYLLERDYKKSTEYFEKASAIAPNAAVVRTGLGMSKLGQGDSASGIAELELAATLDPKPAMPGLLLVMTHLRLGEYDKALAAIAKVEKTQPNNALLQNLKGGAYAGKKDFAAARTSFEKSLAIQPDFFPAVSSLAILDVQEKKPDVAKKRLEKFLEANKTDMRPMQALSSLALSQGHKEEAVTWLQKASTEKPDDLKLSLALTGLYLQVGEKEKALALAQKLQTANPSSPEALEILGQAQLVAKDFPAALQNYKKLAVMVPTSPVVQFRTAMILVGMKNQAAAIDSLKAALVLKPDYLEAQLALADLEMQRGNYAQALDIAKTVQKQAPKNPLGLALEGDVLMLQKKPELAFNVYERASRIRKTRPLAIRQNDALAQAGKAGQGIAVVTQWLKDYPDDQIMRLYLGTVQLANHQAKAAIEQYLIVLKADPKNVVVMNNLALAYQEEKDPRALEYAEKAYALSADNAAVLDTLGWILVSQANLTRGLPLLEKATVAAPASFDVRYHFAQGLVKSGDKVKGRKELEQSLASATSSDKTDEAKAMLKQLQ